MASLGTPLPQFHEAKSSATTLLWQVYHHRPRTQRTKLLALASISFLLFFFLLIRSSRTPDPDYWTKFPSRHPFPNRPEDAQLVMPRPDISVNGSLPQDLSKANPQFHVLVPAEDSSRGVCRTMTSAMILEYPPLSMIGWGLPPSPGATALEQTVQRITRMRDYLRDSHYIHDRDIVLIVDGEDVFFQLPPRVLLQRFQNILRTTNRKLAKKYGYAELPTEGPDAQPELVQKYEQRVLFGASKECIPSLHNDSGCVTVPQSSLPPDVYGWKTDESRDGTRNRPRWLNPGAVMGQAADVRLIYDEMLQQLESDGSNKTDEHYILTQMYGRQEVLRELERRRTTNRAKDWLYRTIGISDANNITGVNARLETGHRYEYGIGVDFESQLFFNQILSRHDVAWVKYSNISRMSTLQMEHRVPREHRLLLPTELAECANPFVQTRFAKDEEMAPPYNETLDKLPDPNERSWVNVPLMTNPHSASIPALVHLNGDKKLRGIWWEKMWFFPWARALLRKYVRNSRGFDSAQSALLGGQDWWDTRGGRGGIWTDEEEWIPLYEVCQGEERDLFDDDLGPFGKENGDPLKPVYNQFGTLIKGEKRRR
ncbi:hypothetical protein N7474_004213 [Penicillium riverlandense]|uniref:uncharacterized protein n=1 Tax=Penicillium riverlandense TaxID=1903569 RepID=UPI0025497F8F|nr:uncharacterized protein N7474_004213 [Penicillium riverlandense]KAJ5818622.1 hypothetical protein N7474_004213 [Penicillium riverlandense]